MMKEKSIDSNKKTKVIDAGTIDRAWEFSQEPRLEGMLKMLKYIKWTNINE